MDDRLQRRLRDADPLTAKDGQTPNPARLDAIREQIMQTNEPARRAVTRPRILGAMGAAAVFATVLIGVSLLRPAATTLAWSAAPTPVGPAQKAAAEAACATGLPSVKGPGTPADASAAPFAGSGPIVQQGTSVVGGGSAGGQGGSSDTMVNGPAPDPAKTMPSTLPPLVSLELHGSGGIAIFADDTTTAYCLLVQQGDTFRMGGLLIPFADGGMIGVAAMGEPGTMSGSGPDSGPVGGQSIGAAVGSPDGLQVTAMALTYEGASVGIIVGVAPDGITSVAVSGGPADGGIATVTNGRFALWAPGTLGAAPVTFVGLDAAGDEVARQTLFAEPPPNAPVFVTSSGAPATP